jgi:hypothetical protein
LPFAIDRMFGELLLLMWAPVGQIEEPSAVVHADLWLVSFARMGYVEIRNADLGFGW